MAKNNIAALICDNYRKELEAVTRSEGMGNVDIVSFPANCHRYSSEDCSFTCGGDDAARTDYESVHVFHCSCVAGAACAHLRQGACFSHKEEHCFNMIAEKNIVDSLLREGAYILSPGWLEKWRSYMAQWGMEREIAREFFAESAGKLVLLDTLGAPSSAIHLAEFSHFVGLRSESIPTGLDYFRNYIRVKLA